VNLKLLIDGVVRQTTVLIAQLSTASGVRAPLSHVADQVFVELAREIEAQGVRRQVAADMFGLALRSYQKKMRRLAESASVGERTLWQAVLDLIEREQPTRRRLIERFERDGEREVAAVLKDLLRSGLVSVTGTGNQALYAVTSPAVRDRLTREADFEGLANWIWLAIFRREVEQRATLAETLGIDAELAERALAELLQSGRVTERDGKLESTNVVLPVGVEQGWEAAVLDHFRAMTIAIASKIRAGASDRIGGSTFTFTVTPGHPHEREVYDLLKRTRALAQSLWDKVAAHNDAEPPDPEQSVRVTYYLGQTLEIDDERGHIDGSEK
jgi:hypothetical protein